MLARLRISHTRVIHGHLMNRNAAPTCSTYYVSLTVNYIMQDSFVYNRNRISNRIPRRIENVLGNDPSTTDRVIQYLQEIRLFDRI